MSASTSPGAAVAEDRVYVDLQAEDKVSRPAKAAAESVEDLGKAADKAGDKLKDAGDKSADLGKKWEEFSKGAGPAMAAVLGIAAAGGVAVAGTFAGAVEASDRLKAQVEQLGQASQSTLKTLGDAISSTASWQALVESATGSLSTLGTWVENNTTAIDRLVKQAVVPLAASAAVAAPLVGTLANSFGALITIAETYIDVAATAVEQASKINLGGAGRIAVGVAGGGVFGGLSALGAEIVGGAAQSGSGQDLVDRTTKRWSDAGESMAKVQEVADLVSKAMSDLAASVQEASDGAMTFAPLDTGGGRKKGGGKRSIYRGMEEPSIFEPWQEPTVEQASPVARLGGPSEAWLAYEADAAKKRSAAERAAMDSFTTTLSQGGISAAQSLGVVALQGAVAGASLASLAVSLEKAAGQGLQSTGSQLIGAGGVGTIVGIGMLAAGTILGADADRRSEQERRDAIGRARNEYTTSNPLPVHVVKSDVPQVTVVTQWIGNGGRSTSDQGAEIAKALRAAQRAGRA